MLFIGNTLVGMIRNQTCAKMASDVRGQGEGIINHMEPYGPWWIERWASKKIGDHCSFYSLLCLDFCSPRMLSVDFQMLLISSIPQHREGGSSPPSCLRIPEKSGDLTLSGLLVHQTNICRSLTILPVQILNSLQYDDWIQSTCFLSMWRHFRNWKWVAIVIWSIWVVGRPAEGQWDRPQYKKASFPGASEY